MESIARTIGLGGGGPTLVGGYERIVTTGGPIDNEFERWGAESYAERARSYLVRNGISDATVIAVTARAMQSDFERSREAGFVEHITKPIDLVGLLAVINRMLGFSTAPG